MLTWQLKYQRAGALAVGAAILMCTAACASARHSSGEIDVNALSQANATNAELVRRLVLTDALEYRAPQSDARAEELRRRMTETYLSLRERRTKEAADRGLDERQMAEIRRDYDQRLESVDGSVAVWKANRSYDVDRVVTIDFAHLRARIEQRDRRDIDRLVRELGLTDYQRLALDRTLTTPVSATGATDLIAREKLAGARPSGAFFEHETALLAGLIPQFVLNGQIEAIRESRDANGVSRIHVTGRTAGAARRRFEVTLAPEFGHRVLELCTFADDGRAHFRFRVDRYESLAGVPIPAITETTRRIEGEDEPSVERRTVSSANIAGALPNESFDIPAGYRVQTLQPEARP